MTVIVAARIFAPPLNESYPHATKILDRNGQVLRLKLSGDEKLRLFLPLKEISPALIEAFLNKEDQHFYTHFGLNPWSLMRAVFRSYIAKSRLEGGSTVTMQLARLIKPLNTRTISGKLQQILWATYYEVAYSKDEILEAYLNKLPFGGYVEGVESATYLYFGKSARQLTADEIATLVEIPQNPARAKKLAARPVPFHAPHFVLHELEKHPNLSEIKTTLDLKLQLRLQSVLRAYLKRIEKLGLNNATAVLLDSKTKEVRSWIGSADFFSNEIFGQVDGVTALRSPGSTLKPFLYGLAMDQGLIHPETLLKDAPWAMGVFQPENFDREFAGPVSATEALIRSRNIPAVQLSKQLQDPDFYNFLIRAGMRFPHPAEYYGFALSLGGFEVSMLQLATWYSMLANRGENLLSPEATFLALDMLAKNNRETDSHWSQWAKDRFPIAWKTGTSQRYRDAWTAGIFGNYTLVVWVGNFDGQANPHLIGREVAAPLFFQMAEAVFNFDVGQAVGVSAQDRVRLDFQNPLWRSPLGLNLKNVSVCALSGGFATPACPHKKESLFIPGKSPIHTCEIHRRVLVSTGTGKRICHFNSDTIKETRFEVHEFWPSDLMKLFQMAGLSRRQPPQWERGCEEDAGNQGVGPKIVSPREEVEYGLNIRTLKPEPIPLLATTDADTKTINWFVDKEFVGQSTGETPLMWTPKTGHFFVRAIDEHGRSDERTLTVRYE